VKYLKGQVFAKDLLVKLGRVRYRVREVSGGEDPLFLLPKGTHIQIPARVWQ